MLKRITGNHQGARVVVEFDSDVYQPGPLTWALCDLMEVRPGDRVVDVGCGTGYIGLVAALLGAGKVICTDIVDEAIRWTLHNAELNGLSNLEARKGGELDPIAGEEADMILTLPPQMPFAFNFNPWRYGGTDGCEVILRIINQALPILAPRKGRLYLIHSALANPPRVRAALEKTARSWELVKTMEKEWDPVDAGKLHPGLYDYLLEANRQGKAELEKRGDRYFYPVWFYRIDY